MKQLLAIVLAFPFGVQLSCSAAVTDPATRLAYGLERTLKEHQGQSASIETTYEFDVPRGYVVVLHPDGEQTPEQLVAAGLSKSQVDAVQRLRLGSNAAIYVLSSDPAMQNSRTTYQCNFVRIPQVMVVARPSSEPLAVSIAGPPDDRFIKSIR